jgi:NADH dehydrogenase
MSRVAVTGAAGFVGKSLVPELLGAGHEVRALVHDRTSNVPGAEVRRGDVRDSAGIHALVEGCTAVIHLAPGLRATPDLETTIVEGTKTVVAAAREAGVQRVVVLSCLGAQAASHYPFYEAKWKAEQIVRGSGLPYVILRPSLILGPGDGITAQLAGQLRSFPAVAVPGSGRHRQQPIDIDDLVRCILLSVGRDDLLNREISVGGPMYITPRQLLDLLGGALGCQKPKVTVPAGWLGAAGHRFPGQLGLLSRARIAQLDTESAASLGIVESVFGFPPRSVIPRLGSYVAADTLA